MDKIIIVFFILLFQSIHINAQNIYPLDTPFDEVPNQGYVKDLNNELDPYIGKYIAMDNGKTIELNITKHLKNQESSGKNRKYFKDILKIKIAIKDYLGNVIYENFTHPKDKFKSIFIMPTRDTLVFYYSGTNCAVGWGRVFLKKLNATQIQWNYKPESARTEKCPNADLTLYLPQTKDLIFTKQ